MTAAVAATLTDDLSAVLDDATVIAAPAASDGSPLTFDGTHLSWSGTVQPDVPVLITYTVQVDDSLGDGHLLNAVVSPRCPPAGSTPSCSVEHFAGTYDVTKTADVPDGATVEPGQVINYTITVTRSGWGAAASLTDDLSRDPGRRDHRQPARCVRRQFGVSLVGGVLCPGAGSSQRTCRR